MSKASDGRATGHANLVLPPLHLPLALVDEAIVSERTGGQLQAHLQDLRGIFVALCDL